jgi:hypothetical protein
MDEGGSIQSEQAHTWKRRKRKTKPYGVDGKGIARDLILLVKMQ